MRRGGEGSSHGPLAFRMVESVGGRAKAGVTRVVIQLRHGGTPNQVLDSEGQRRPGLRCAVKSYRDLPAATSAKRSLCTVRISATLAFAVTHGCILDTAIFPTNFCCRPDRHGVSTAGEAPATRPLSRTSVIVGMLRPNSVPVHEARQGHKSSGLPSRAQGIPY